MEILTLEEVSKILKVNERTVVSWAEKGEFPGGKLGSAWRFRKRDVDAWLSRRLGAHRSETPNSSQGTLQEFIRPDHFFYTQAESKREIIDFLATKAGEAMNDVDETFIRNEIWHRESLMSTGIGLGIGIPHIKIDPVSQVEVFFAVNKNDITDYDSLDSKPVRIIILIIAGNDNQALYLKALSTITFILKSEAVRTKLLNCATDVEIEAVIRGAHQ